MSFILLRATCLSHFIRLDLSLNIYHWVMSANYETRVIFWSLHLCQLAMLVSNTFLRTFSRHLVDVFVLYSDCSSFNEVFSISLSMVESWDY